MPERHQFAGEPCFARRALPPAARVGEALPPQAEDDGYILTLLTDGRTEVTELVVLDAARVDKGPVARLPVGTNLPHGLHGCWAEAQRPSVTELESAAKLLKMYQRKSTEWNQVDAAFSGLGIAQFFGQKGMDGR